MYLRLLFAIDAVHPHTSDIVEIKHIMLPPTCREFKDIYVVFELLETDLHQVGCVAWVSGLDASMLMLSIYLQCTDVTSGCLVVQSMKGQNIRTFP